jgi:Cft2 family RNA processing exonuclease
MPIKPEDVTKEHVAHIEDCLRSQSDWLLMPDNAQIATLANALIEAGIVSPRESIEFDEICLRRAIEISKTGVYGYSMAHVGLEPLLSVIKARIAEKRGKNDQA